MDQLNRHPLEDEADHVINDLGRDLATMKSSTDTGTSYSFIFNAENDCGVVVYLALPIYVPSRANNLFRIEFTIGEVKTEDVGRILLAITLDMDFQGCTPLRVIPRTKDHWVYKIVLQTVCSVDVVRGGFLTSTVLTGLELAEFYRNEFFLDKVRKLSNS